MHAAYPHIQEAQVAYTMWNNQGIGKVLEDIKIKEKPKVEARNAPRPTKNLLRACVVYRYKDDVNFRYAEWEDLYLSGWVSATQPGYRTAGNVALHGIKQNNITTQDFIDLTNTSKFIDSWSECNNINASSNFQSFAMFNSHTEQSFLYDVFVNSKAPEVLEVKPNHEPPVQVLLYLFSTREACGKCQSALNGLYITTETYNRKKLFLQRIFGDAQMSTAKIDFQIIFSHYTPLPQIILGGFDLNRLRSVVNLTDYSVIGQVHGNIQNLPPQAKLEKINLKPKSDPKKDQQPHQDGSSPDEQIKMKLIRQLPKITS
ncbi:MAG: hypothetical protein EOO46_16285 [Flavobacterium sp.]|nr:MAG: hypothetical protein EOO46_16285 [Flavobacterium sp.]